ncbi:Protein of unknown function [Chitinophaga costaii]|uniref:DinB superfamily protein n=1 Tax=Chitinophaga costaii TaxID=1335309 RepID=A0A1C4ER85_9BACT|nr:DUF1572 family protein [Chitinophaga costaii]PUZ22537.1 DUF1572 domain-containing protein [Chitinophaga costaii]SCC46104.1 Protein of unknown function [Chitinophaga costaii]
MSTLASLYKDSLKKRLLIYKNLGEHTFAQLDEIHIHWQPAGDPNSIFIIVRHMAGNMLSRFTDFLTTDGEKPFRNRDEEFKPDTTVSKASMLEYWNKGWDCLFQAIDHLQPEDFEKIIYIRQEPHTVIDALNRQLSHYPYHVGQIVYLGKMLTGEKWQSLSIPKGEGQSQAFNDKMAQKNN